MLDARRLSCRYGNLRGIADIGIWSLEGQLVFEMKPWFAEEVKKNPQHPPYLPFEPCGHIRHHCSTDLSPHHSPDNTQPFSPSHPFSAHVILPKFDLPTVPHQNNTSNYMTLQANTLAYSFHLSTPIHAMSTMISRNKIKFFFVFALCSPRLTFAEPNLSKYECVFFCRKTPSRMTNFAIVVWWPHSLWSQHRVNCGCGCVCVEVR